MRFVDTICTKYRESGQAKSCTKRFTFSRQEGRDYYTNREAVWRTQRRGPQWYNNKEIHYYITMEIMTAWGFFYLISNEEEAVLSLFVDRLKMSQFLTVTLLVSKDHLLSVPHKTTAKCIWWFKIYAI